MADVIFSLPAGLPADPTLFSTLLDLLPMGVMYYTPVLDATGTLADLTLAYLNPAAQRMTRLPAQPGTTYRQQFPTTDANGAWDFHRRSWLGPAPQQFQFYYDVDGFDAHFRVTAQRLGQGLLTIFTDTQDEVRSQAEVALLASQARERAALAEAKQERTNLVRVFERASVAIGLFRGPQHVTEVANEEIGRILNRPAALLVGKPIFEAAPDLREQGLEALMDSTFRDGTPYDLREVPVQVHRAGSVRPTQGYFNITYQPQHDEHGQRSGVVCLAVEVTEQVVARQQAEQLNQELEARVQARTQELHAQQTLLQRALDGMPAYAATLSGPEHRVSYANAAFQRLLGDRAILGLPNAEAVPEAVDQGLLALLDQVYTSGQALALLEVPLHLPRADGELRLHYINTTYQPLPDAQGRPQNVLAFGVDVTEQVVARQQNAALQAELLAAAQARVQAQESFYQVFEQTPALVALLRGTDHQFEYVNPAYQALFAGRPLVGLTAAAAVPELFEQGFGALLDRVYQTGETYFGLELPFTPAATAGQSARTGYFTFTYQVLREVGEITGISIFAYDVTAQLQEREASAQQLRLITDSLPVLISYLDGEEIYRFVNQAYEPWFNQRAADLVGQSARAVVGEQAYRLAKPYIDRALAGEQVEFESRMPYREGFTKHIHSTFVPAKRAGVPDGFYTLTFDITEQVQSREQVQALNQELTATNEELHESNTQLTRTNVDLDNFIYTASHDLKAPITNIEGLLLALEHELPAVGRVGDVPLMLTMIQEATERFRRTINHLTDLSRLQKEHNPDAEAVALAPVVEAVRLDLGPLLTQTQGQLTVTIPEGLTVLFAEKNLRSVVYNLLSNAFKYHHPDRRPDVQLRSWLAGKYAVLEVQDNGLGLDLAQGQERLFAMFQRLHTHVEGTGVGLYMVKRILENAGGHIEVTSRLGQGSTFRVYFPR